MQIKLILSAIENDPLRKKDPFMPLSLAILAGSAPEHSYKFTDMLWDSIDIDYDEEVDIVGISVRMSAEKIAFEIADEFRKRKVKVVMGGPQVSVNPFESLKHADAVAIGEGEKLWPEIVKNIKNNELKDFYVCSPLKFDSKGHSVFQLQELPSLENLPKPRRELFRRNYTFEMVFASRGCPINCDFCSVSRIFGSKYRLRPIDEVVNEISDFQKYYYLIDDTVFGRNNTYDYYIELYDKIAKIKDKNYWIGQANLNAAASDKGRKVIKKAAEAGMIYAAIGMESINRDVLKKSGSFSKMGLKNNDDVLEKMKENIRFIQDQGILISGWFTIGYDDDDEKTYYSTLKFCEEMNIIPVFTPVHALKGTDLYDRLKLENKLTDNHTNVTNVKHPTLTNRQVIDANVYVVKKGFEFTQVLKRSWFFMSKLRKQKSNSVGDIIHKTIFALITQINMGKITRGEVNKMKNKIKDNEQ
ncbi:MAG: hypothetical protein B6D61_12570 [Bacteroidetes bacterium 4484_249]|nr:MAG: hypothetical protein B6D61_12570 [Bacteroidetes bacterium 4484_249]